MDIIDIMLARAMTPQGKTETYVAKANKAARDAAQAKADAATAIATVEDAADEIATAREEAASLLTEAQDVLETVQQAQLNTIDISDVDAEIKQAHLDSNIAVGSTANIAQVSLVYPDNTSDTENVIKMYKSTGDNEDGTMTQKAIKAALDAIPATSGGGGNVIANFGIDDEGRIVIVGPNGTIIAGDTTEGQIIESLLRAGIYQAKDAVGLDINYEEKSFIRTQESTYLSMGSDFDSYTMYGGRMRCNVSDNGTINAFYGDSNYADDGSNGQVMVYQPKFYYQRTPLKTSNAIRGQIIRHESIMISATKQSGFKLHPIFDGGNGEELDYVLFPAYEGTVYNNKLQSISGSQPTNNMTILEAEYYARQRGEGWHIMNMAAISANQMLEIIEFGKLNGQEALESGLSTLTSSSDTNNAAIIGSTSSLGNLTGHADMTLSIVNGNTVQNTEASKRAITYRGMENPWGNMWNMIGGVIIKGDGYSQGGAPYICTGFDYALELNDNYNFIGFFLPAAYGWVSGFGYSGAQYDWVFMPAECSTSANSLTPVGDNLWTISGVSENKIAAIGGSFNYEDKNGPFYYAADRNVNESSRYNYNARLMYIPTKNAIYDSNIAKWRIHMGG